MKLISIIVPVYNSQDTINRCIDSVINQTASNWEIIAVNDGSTDNSPKILKKYSSVFENIRVFHQKNAGPGAARNLAISKALGEYIAFLDSDDWWEKDFVELVNLQIDKQQPDIIFYDLVCENAAGKTTRIIKNSNYRSCDKLTLLKYQMVGKMEWGMVKVIKKRILQDTNVLFSNKNVGEEQIFSFVALNNAKEICFIEKAIYHYVYSSNGQHKKGGDDPWREMVFELKRYLVESEDYSLFRMAMNSLAAKAVTISCYRLAVFNSLWNSKKKIKARYNEYSNSFDFQKIDKKCLSSSIRFALFFIKHNLILPIFIISRLREWRNRS